MAPLAKFSLPSYSFDVGREGGQRGIKRAIPFYSRAECAILCEYELGSSEGRGDRDPSGRHGREKREGERYEGKDNLGFGLVSLHDKL